MRDALAFLTILPVRARNPAPDKSALMAFPLVGLAMGGLWALVAWASSHAWSPLVGAAFILVADLIVTGGLHLDALADLADGIASRKPSAEAVQIMRDPRIGAVGAGALATFMLARLALLALIVSRGRLLLLLPAPAVGRFAMVWLMSRSEVAPAGSLASHLGEAATRDVALVTGVVTLGIGALAGGVNGAAAVAGGLLLAELGTAFFRRRFGGLVGDAVGALGFSAELVALALLAARLM